MDWWICAISFVFPSRSFCGACHLFFPTRCFARLEKVEGTYISWREMVWLQVHAFAVSWITVLSLLSLLLSFFLFFRNVPKTFKNPNKIHLLIYAFIKLVNKKGKGTRGEIWCGSLCVMQDSHPHPSNIYFSFAAEFIVKTKTVPLVNDCSFRGCLRTEKTNYMQLKCLFVCKLPNIYSQMM